MGMMLAQEGRAEAKRQNSKELPIQYQQCQIYRKFLGVLISPPCLGLIFLDHAILSLLSTSPHCPTQPFLQGSHKSGLLLRADRVEQDIA